MYYRCVDQNEAVLITNNYKGSLQNVTRPVVGDTNVQINCIVRHMRAVFERPPLRRASIPHFSQVSKLQNLDRRITILWELDGRA